MGRDRESREPPTGDLSPTHFETLIEAAESLGPDVDESSHWRELELDRFELVRELGRGGMGLVFLARQTDPVEREVALKLVRRRVVNPTNLARFEVERQALAQMQHPAIAQVYDAGTTAEGHPYFAMEYVDGTPLDGFCRMHQLSLADRLDLFVRICQGVQHAHQKGIIHRDLKPANILVTRIDGIAVPKIIDFGIATTTGADGDRRSWRCERIGTPEYMSPEQFGPHQSLIDTRSDVYALGVILHELLVDQPPIARTHFSATRDPAELARMFHRSTRQPSAQLDGRTALAVAEQRRTSPRRLRRALRPDLDAVVMKALAPDPEARYASAGDLAADVQRTRRHEPVTALPGSLAYRTRKFLRRHALALGSASAVLLALLAGLAAATLSMFEAQRQFRIAEQRQQELEQVSRFQQAMLEGISPQAMGAGIVSELERQLRSGLGREGIDPNRAEALLEPVHEHVSPTDLARQTLDRFLLDRAVASADEQFASQPRLQADLFDAIHAVYAAIDHPERLPELAERTVALRTAEYGPRALETLESRIRLGQSLYRANRLTEARTELEAARSLLDASQPGHRQALVMSGNHLGTVLVDSGSMETAIDLMTTNAEQARDWFGPFHDLTINTIASTGFVHARARNFEQGLVYFEQTLEALRQTLEPDDPRLGRAMLNVASSYGQLGRLEEALEMDRDIVAFMTAAEGRRSSNTLRAMSNMANNLSALGYREQARELLVEASELAGEALGAEHPITLRTQVNLGSLLSRMGHPEQAQQLLENVVEVRVAQFGPDHQETLSAQEILASIMLDQTQPGPARELIETVLERRSAVFGEDHPQTMIARHILAVSLADLGRPEEAIEPAARAARFFEQRLGANDDQTLRTSLVWYRALLASGQAQAASEVRRNRLSTLTGTEPDPRYAGLVDELLEIEATFESGEDEL